MTLSAQAPTATPAFADPRQLSASYEAALAAGQACECWLRIAGGTVLLRSSSPEMLDRVTRTFTHLRCDAQAAADLTMHLWDTVPAGLPDPPLPDVHGEQQPGAFFYYSDDDVRAGFQLGTSGDARVLAVYPHAAPPSLSVLDISRSEAWYWMADAGRMPYWEQATPVKYLLDWWMSQRGLKQVHAGAVGTPEGGVLLVGKSGSGKSTSTLSCLQSDLLYAGDDYVGVAIEPEPYVHSLYTSGKIMPDHVERLPFLLPVVANPDDLGIEKAVVYVHEHWPQAVTPGFPLRALLAPRVTPGLTTSRIVEVSRAEGLAALAPSTVFQMHTQARQSLAQMSRLLGRIPCYRLELGSDIPSIPRAIEGLLGDLNQGA